MGGVAVVHPQDVLKNRLNCLHNPKPLISSTKSKNSSMKFRGRNPNFIPNPNPNPNPNPDPNFSKSSNRRKRSPQKKNTSDLSSSPPLKNKKCNLVMGQVKILKRGEALTDRTLSFRKDDIKEEEKQKFDKGCGGLVAEGLVSAARAKQNSLVDFYAGSAFITSPAPSDLPVPAFFKKKSGGVFTESNNNNKNATIDLLRLLKLDPESVSCV